MSSNRPPDKPTYKELEKRVDRAEQIVDVLEGHQVDAVVSGRLVSVVQLREVQDKLARSQETVSKHLTEIETIYRSAPIGLCVLNDRLEYIRVNRRMAEINRVDFEEHIGKTIWEINEQLAVATEAELRRVLETGEPVRSFEVVLRDPRDPASRTYRMESYFPLKDNEGEIRSINVAVEDVSELREAQEALRRLNATLEEQVLQRTERLKQLNEDLRKRAEQLSKMAMEVSEAEDRERERLSDMLHDDIQQLLVAAQQHLETLKKDSAGPDRSSKELERVIRLIADSVQKTRDLSHEISPPVHREGSLSDMLTWLIEKMNQRYDLEVALDVKEEVCVLSERIARFVFKAVNELLFNVRKHSGVRNAEISVKVTNERVEVVVSDKGRGFNPFNLEEKNGGAGAFGLIRIRERLFHLGGELGIESEPGKGASFTICLPTNI